ncbi:MAG TPA: ATP-binding cassette domain-containing protein, partial [Terracidiphilus sp.]
LTLESQNLSRSLRGIPAIQNVSFTLASGEIVGFLGPNGAGKSTTVKIITGMLRPNHGSVLGYVPEEAHLYTTHGKDLCLCRARHD